MPYSDYRPDLMGTATLEPAGRFEAGSMQSFTLTYTAGAFGVDDTGSIKIGFRFATDFGPVQFTDPKAAGYTTVEAQLEGRTGNILQKAGNIVTANTTDLATIYQVEPIYVTFAVPEARLGDIKRYSEANKLAVTARAQDGSGGVETGQLTFIDNTVDTSTGTIKLKGTFPNKQHKLWPGQFVNVGLRLTTRNNAVVVPNQAVQTGQDGTYVYVVGEDRAVSVRPVKTGPRIDQDMVIDDGLKGGETVVTEGQLRLQPGSKVQVRGQQTGEGRPRSSP